MTETTQKAKMEENVDIERIPNTTTTSTIPLEADGVADASTLNNNNISKHYVGRTSSMSSGEYELQRATNPRHKATDNTRSKWIIPDSDSEDDDTVRDGSGGGRIPPHEYQYMASKQNNKPDRLNINLPSDGDDELEENLYGSVKSPTFSVKSMEPPAPPPVSTMPKRTQAMNKLAQSEQAPAITTQLHVPSNSANDYEETSDRLIRHLSVASSADTDTYAEIENELRSPTEGNHRASQPRFNFSISKSRGAANHDCDDMVNGTTVTYAKIPKKPRWNFPSSDEEDDNVVECRNKGQQPKRRPQSSHHKSTLHRQESSTSEEGERPKVPPKLFDAEDELSLNGNEMTETELQCLRRHSNDSGIRESKQSSSGNDEFTIEYDVLQRDADNHDGSLIGVDGEQFDSHGSQSSGFEDNHDANEISSTLSNHSSNKIDNDYEQISTCVDMDRLSLDSSGQRPRRIVETHETHEIIACGDGDDDIVERIIETQTITEKLDDGCLMRDHCGEDFSKCLEDENEFVSHIFTLGRTMEKGGGKKKYKANEFAFVENPFAPGEPMIETMPLEKKTVKQKITTLVKKKKIRDTDDIYADVQPIDPQNLAESSECHHDEDTDNTLLHQSQSDPRLSAGGDTDSVRTSDNSASLFYETMEEVTSVKSIKRARSDRRRNPKTEKKSLFSGLRKLLKKGRSQQSLDTDKSSAVVFEGDYQEFVP